MLRDGIESTHGPRAVIGRFALVPSLVAVVDERDDEVRVVIEDATASARFAAWVPVGYLSLTVTRPVALAVAGSRDARPREEHAAVLYLPGVMIREFERVGDRVLVDSSDGHLNAHGWVDADVLARRWLGHQQRLDERASRQLAPGVAIRIRPSRAATIAATTQQAVPAVELRRDADWTEVRVLGAFTRAHGYVANDDKGGNGDGFGGFVRGVLGTRPEWPDVPAGTCLVESVGGEVIGVTLEVLPDREPVPGGAKVVLEVPWASVTLIAEQDGDEWRRCADL
ncbi:MAG TPA: hypothetical protein VML75_02155 [Kofleriaceae bacterium]|nr:hypothetical protein [Kofleriaceae bacterium]